VTPPAGETNRQDLRLVPAALTSWAVTAAGILWGAPAAIVVVTVAVGAAAAAMGYYRREQPTVPTVWPAVLAVGIVGGAFSIAVALRVHDLEHHPMIDRFGTTAEVVVSPIESPRPLGGARLMFRGVLKALDGNALSGRVVVFAPIVGYGDLTAGRPATFRARIVKPTRHDLTVAALSAVGAPKLGDASVIQRLAAGVRSGFAASARAVLPPDQAAMVPALVLGDTSALSRQTTDEFRVAGLTHLTAVSGANVTIVCGTILLSAVLLGPRFAVALAALALVAFVIVVQPSASVLRAAVMGGITLVAVASHRRRQALPALSACVIALMVAAPELAVDVGFALSVSATAALVVIAPVWSRRLVGRGWPKALADATSVAVAAQLVTAPLVAGISGSVSLVSVVANLAVAVVIPPITVIGTAAAIVSTTWPAAARLLIRFTGPETWWLLRVAHWGAAVPGAAVPVPSGLTGVIVVAAAAVSTVVLWRWRWGRRGLGIAAVCLLAWALSGSHDTIGA
jgi:competence protein ComEC